MERPARNGPTSRQRMSEKASADIVCAVDSVNAIDDRTMARKIALGMNLERI